MNELDNTDGVWSLHWPILGFRLEWCILLTSKYISLWSSLAGGVEGFIEFLRWALPVEGTEQMRVFATIIESTTTRTTQHSLLSILFIQTLAGGTRELLCEPAVIMIEVLHLSFELRTFSLMRPQKFLHFTTLLVIHFVQVDLAHWVESDGWGDLLL